MPGGKNKQLIVIRFLCYLGRPYHGRRNPKNLLEMRNLNPLRLELFPAQGPEFPFRQRKAARDHPGFLEAQRMEFR